MGIPRHTYLRRLRKRDRPQPIEGGAEGGCGLEGGGVATATASPTRTFPAGKRSGDARYTRLFETLREPARGMVRRAFGSTFSEEELDDFYSSAWVSTLAALERKSKALDDDELRRYLMTAVAHQASREIRRRGRKPTVSLDAVGETTEGSVSPDEAVARAEDAILAREVLGSLPPRRRAVLVFRYGWDLEPDEICRLIEGLSPRAYRKEIERGVAEVAKKLRLVQEGGWCATREPLLRSMVAGVATSDEIRQAQNHLSNCRNCASFVGSLNGHLHDLGGAVAFGAVADGVALDAGSVVDRGWLLVERAKQAVGSTVRS
jgi:RNA polymerase sigma factor (sigma-70 family)